MAPVSFPGSCASAHGPGWTPLHRQPVRRDSTMGGRSREGMLHPIRGAGAGPLGAQPNPRLSVGLLDVPPGPRLCFPGSSAAALLRSARVVGRVSGA
jgi:hypothetical protein